MQKFTSQCHPPRPTAFLTTPWRPTSTDFVRLFPVTTTLVWRGSTESSSSLLSPQLCKCEKPPLMELSIASSIFRSEDSEIRQWKKSSNKISGINKNQNYICAEDHALLIIADGARGEFRWWRVKIEGRGEIWENSAERKTQIER